MHDEGYIKFKADWRSRAPLPEEALASLNYWRNLMYEHHLIGAYPDGIGFGNISCRYRQNTFIISGSATGNIAKTTAEHYSLVTDFDIGNNRISCAGPVIASSESMSHAVIYQTCEEVNAVIHVHHLDLWEKLLFRFPTTAAEAPYGSPEMAREIVRLLQTGSVRRKEKVFVMAGHREGIIAFGEDLPTAAHLLLNLLKIN